MRRPVIFSFILCMHLFGAILAFASVKYIKVASFKDIGQNRAFFIALKEELPRDRDKLEESLWEIVDYYMDKYGQAPQMWIYFFDEKKNVPKEFPIKKDHLKHLIAQYFYATDTRRKDLKIFSQEDIDKLIQSGTIESPLWAGQ